MGAEAPRLREARAGDAPALERIAAVSLPEAWSADGFRAALAGRSAVGWVALDAAGEPAGFALGARAADELEITALAVAPGARRRGLARALLGALLERERASGARRVALEVRASNAAALRLYAGLGFRALGERRTYYRDGESAALLGRVL